MSIDWVQINDQYPTSTVVATIDENNDAHYDIVQHVAGIILKPDLQI